MSPTEPPKWRRAFLRALGDTANVRLSAEIAGVDKTTVYAARNRSAAFASSWDRALEAGKTACTQTRPLAIDLPASGRAVTLRHSKKGRPCLMASGPGRWNLKIEAAFLAHLNATANVSAGARLVGFSTTAIYNRRNSDPGFQHAWDIALAQGYARIEMGLVASASRLLEPGGDHHIDPTDLPEMSVAEAMNLLKLHRAKVKGGAKSLHDQANPLPDIEMVRAEILRKVAALSEG